MAWERIDLEKEETYEEVLTDFTRSFHMHMKKSDIRRLADQYWLYLRVERATKKIKDFISE